jgi:hypothetical protein
MRTTCEAVRALERRADVVTGDIARVDAVDALAGGCSTRSGRSIAS